MIYIEKGLFARRFVPEDRDYQTDAWTADWTRGRSLAIPPLALLPRVVQQLTDIVDRSPEQTPADQRSGVLVIAPMRRSNAELQLDTIAQGRLHAQFDARWWTDTEIAAVFRGRQRIPFTAWWVPVRSTSSAGPREPSD